MSMFNVAYMAGGRFDPPFMPTKTQPFIKGIQLAVGGAIQEYSSTYTVPEEMELLSVSLGCSRYNPKDNWSLLLNGDPILSTVYTKNLPEGAYLVAVIPVSPGDEFELIYDNQSGVSKYVWFNYQFLK
jgi:hypothetical protein